MSRNASAYDAMPVSQKALRRFKIDIQGHPFRPGSFKYVEPTIWEASTIKPNSASGALFLAAWYSGYRMGASSDEFEECEAVERKSKGVASV